MTDRTEHLDQDRRTGGTAGRRPCSGQQAARTALVDALLAAEPELAGSLTAAQLATRAQLRHVAAAAPGSTADVLDGLREYLGRPQGSGPWPPSRG